MKFCFFCFFRFFCCLLLLQVCDSDLKRVDFYDSKFDLGALSIADLSLQSSSDSQDYAEFKRAVKFSLFFQPAFSVSWFLGVVALENRQSCIMPVTFVICYNILVWNVCEMNSLILTLILILMIALAELVHTLPFAVHQPVDNIVDVERKQQRQNGQ